MEFLWLVLLTIPVFYIYGLYSIVRDVLRRGDSQSTPENTNLAKKLELQAIQSPNKTISEFLREQKGDGQAAPMQDSETAVLNPTISPAPQPNTSEDFFTRWYSTNSINLLLYIGAFLIVASAAIFVGFQWETIPGITKALLLTIIAVAFFGFGLWFYSLPKIKTAGATFIAIAAILIPVLGAAWYTFVLREAGVSVGIAWSVTSAVALITYLSLALYFKTQFYAYASTIGTFSLLLSLVNTFQLDRDFYLLASINACFILLIVSQFLKKSQAASAAVLSSPSEISSEIAMPITLVYGLPLAISENRLFTLEGVLSAFLAALFYFVSYSLTKASWKLALSQVLFLATLYIFGGWQQYTDVLKDYLVSIIGASLSLLGYYYTNLKKQTEADLSLGIALFCTVLMFALAWTGSVAAIHIAILSLLPLLTSVIIAVVKKSYTPLLIAASFLAVFLFITYNQVLNYEQFPQYLGLIYLMLSIGCYALTYQFRKNQEASTVGFLTTGLFAVLSMAMSIDHHEILVICTATVALLFFASSILYEVIGISYAGVFFAWVSVLLLLSLNNAPQEIYPPILCFFAYLLFFLSRLAPKHLLAELRVSSLTVAVLSSAFYFVDNQFAYPHNNPVMRNALIGAYGTTLLYSVDYLIYKTKHFAYVTSFVALLTLIWQIDYLGITNTLMYTTPVGIYFLAIAYTRKLQGDKEYQNLFNLIAMCFLIVPPYLLSTGDNAMRYSVILGVEGILLVFLGISLSDKIFRYAGVVGIILAVLPQTYNYILSLPRWVVVGVLGILFLGFAIYLLLKRKEEILEK